MDTEKIKRFFEADRFCAGNGIYIKELNEDFCVCAVKIESRHLNAGDTVQGGVIFTLGDFAFAVHANASGTFAVSQGADINYLRPARGGCLYATATLVSGTKRTVLYNVDITDDNGDLIAVMSVRGFIKGENPAIKENL